MRRQLSWAGALWRGLVAGAIGAGVQTLFFRLTRRITPETPRDAFTPPDPAQKDEMATETVARRVATLAGRGPLEGERKKRAGHLVHYGYGTLWGGAYALARESLPAAARPLGVAGYGTAIWMLSDNLLLPAFRLAAPPWRYPAKVHAYAWLAHVAYGAGTAAGYELLRRWSGASLVAAGALLLGRRRLHRRLPRPLWRATDAIMDAITPAVRRAARIATSAVRP